MTNLLNIVRGIARAVADKARNEPAVTAGLIVSISDAVVASPSWSSLLPAVLGVVIRFFVSPAYGAPDR